MGSILVPQRSSQGKHKPSPGRLAGSGLRLEEADQEGRAHGWRREEEEWLLGGLRQEQESLTAHQNSPWNVLWQQAWAFCSGSAREQQGLGRTLY